MTREESFPTSSQLAVIGAGPIGLEAAAWAASRGWDVVVFERGEVAEHVRRWGHVRLFSPFSLNHSSWGPTLLRRAFPDWEAPEESAYQTGREFRRSYLLPLAALPGLKGRIRTGVEVRWVGKRGLGKAQAIGQASRLRCPFRLLLRWRGRELLHHTQAVIDASGVFGNPRFCGAGNLPALGEEEARAGAQPGLHYEVVDPAGLHRELLAGRKVLLVGGGHSAATALEGFLKLASRGEVGQVIWVNRTVRRPPYQRFPDDPLPYRDELSRLANELAEQPPPWLRYRPGSWVEALEFPRAGEAACHVRLGGEGGEERFWVEQVIANAGFEPDNRIYRQLQVHECYATLGPIQLAAQLLGGSADCLTQASPALQALQNPEPGFFILGHKSYGTNSSFLIRHGLEQVQLVLEHLGRHFQAHSQPESVSTQGV